MSLQKINIPDRPNPIAERVGEGMFTDREEEMATLMEWVDHVVNDNGKSEALVSHRRQGKTAIMERFYNRLFWERDNVMPFYFELSEGIYRIWREELADIYLLSFLRQFIAYRTRDAGIAFDPKIAYSELYKIAQEMGETLVTKAIDFWLDDNQSSRAAKSSVIIHQFPHDFAIKSGLRIIVMFDEFQRLNQVVYFDEELTRPHLRYTDTFSAAVESVHAPMLIAGSQVTILTQQALAGAMMGRVGTTYIKRLPIDGCAQLVRKFARRRKLDISLEMAYSISRLVDGHPYYIWCLFSSKYRKRDLTTDEGVKATLTFETEDPSGYIRQFWEYNFWQALETFDKPHAREVLLYLSKYPTTEVYIEQLLSDLGLPLTKEEGNQLLRDLIRCDLARQRGRGFYGGLSDPMLARVLRIEFGWEIEQLMRDDAIRQMEAEVAQEIIQYQKELIDKLKGDLRFWTGRFAEMFIDKLMKRHFNDQHVAGEYFNQATDVQLDRFESVFTTMTQPPGATRPYQIDLYSLPRNISQLPWVVEVKNWQTPISQPDVKHFFDAAQNLAKDRGHTQVRCWFYARSGFSTPAEKFMQQNGMFYTDHDGLVELLEALNVIEQWHEDVGVMV
ncbi:MAG: restriction endonuclease [Chloroflexota bacterium]